MLKKAICYFVISIFMALSTEPVLAYSDTSIFDKTKLSKGLLKVSYNSNKGVKTKIMVQKGSNKYFYNLKSQVNIPLQLGNGEYDVAVLENITGNEYVVIKSEKINLELKNKNDVYLNSIENINWNKEMNAVKKAQELTKNSKTDDEKVKNIYNYVVKNISYDYNKMNRIDEDYVPDVESIFKSSKGMCYDYSALFAAMLRSVGVPTKLLKGYKSDTKAYHAWNEVYLNNKWVIIDTTYDATLNSKKLNYTMIKNSNEYSVSKEY